jgi:hypothetical protein
MKSKDDLQQDINLAENAKRLLNDPLLSESLLNMRETLYHNIRTSSYKATDEREECYRMLKAVDAFESQLISKIKGGEKAQGLLEKMLNKFGE